MLMYKRDGELSGRLVRITWALTSAALVVCSARSGWVVMLGWLVIYNSVLLLVRLRRKSITVKQIGTGVCWAAFFCGLGLAYWAVMEALASHPHMIDVQHAIMVNDMEPWDKAHDFELLKFLRTHLQARYPEDAPDIFSGAESSLTAAILVQGVPAAVSWS